jgi:hypothetical protein
MGNIFKVYDLKIKYETVQYIHEKRDYLYIMSKANWNYYFELINGSPSDIEEQKDSISNVKSGENSELIELVPVKPVSEEEMDRYIERLNCTPKQALHDSLDFIQNIKSEKQIYLKCIDEELSKGDSSKYVKDFITPYGFIPPGWSLMPHPASLSKLDFLKVFKEFILNDDEKVLPEGLRVSAYLKCNCKIP